MLAIQDMTAAAHTAILDAKADITQLHQSVTSIRIGTHQAHFPLDDIT
jgi:hypothetical protein